jgi:hypothetical protein
VGLGARFWGVRSRSCRFGSVGGSGPGASRSMELQETAGSAKNRFGARFRKAEVWEGARFGGPDRGGDASATRT